MPRCTHCGRDFVAWDDICPDCGKPADEMSIDAEGTRNADRGEFASSPDDGTAQVYSGPMAVIARFRSAAEAGYFSHELMHVGIPVTLTADDSFDALGGYWSTRFVLAVPQKLAESAAQELQELIEATNIDGFADADYGESKDDLADDEPSEEYRPDLYPMSEMPGEPMGSGVNWVPIVLTLTVGSIAFWAVRKADEQPLPAMNPIRAGEQHRELWNTLATDPSPWVQKSENDRHIRELSFDRHTGSAILREDTTGDGVYDRETLFRQ